MNKCQICEKKFNQEGDRDVSLEEECFGLHGKIAGFCFFKQKMFPKIESKFPNQYAKLKSLLPKLETLVKEQLEPNLKKIEKSLKDFFNKKGKAIESFHGKNWLSSSCEDCQEELKKQIKLAVDEIEVKRMWKNFEKESQELEKVFNELPRNFASEIGMEEGGEGKFEIEFINQIIDKLNKEIIAEREREREREQKWQENRLKTLYHRW